MKAYKPTPAQRRVLAFLSAGPMRAYGSASRRFIRGDGAILEIAGGELGALVQRNMVAVVCARGHNESGMMWRLPREGETVNNAGRVRDESNSD